MKSLINIFLVFIFLYEISQNVKCTKVKVVNLNTWNLTNANGTIHIDKVKSPIGVYSALREKYGYILESKNDDRLRWIAYDNWTFSTAFKTTFDEDQRLNLTLHGIDTVSTVYLNKRKVGKTDNMFVRYSFDILPYLQADNILEIKIISPLLEAQERARNYKNKSINTPPDCPSARANGECHINVLRKMQSSFGGKGNVAAPSMGIWKPVDLEYFEVAIMRDVDVAIRHNDTHWTLDMRLFYSSDARQTIYSEVTFIAIELIDSPLVFNRNISYDSLQVDFKVDIPKENIKLWWPKGYGEQKLYPLYFSSNCWLNPAGPHLKSRTRSQRIIDIGFRTIELVENLDDFGRTFYFKVNNQPIFIKGANYVPSHILPEYSYREEDLMHLLKSATETHMNMIRVYGGGLYESDIFYNFTDFYGLLVWQDLTFTAATYPLDLMESALKETSQNARRLSFHPSLCLFVANDEIELYLTRNKSELGLDSSRLEAEYKQMFKASIRHELNVVSRNDFNPRAGPMISTPSMGVEGSTKELSLDPQNPNFGDVHFWADGKDVWDPDIYPRARFISAYGFQSLPALCSWNRTLYANDSLSDIVIHRQHDARGFDPIIELIKKHFPFFPVKKWEKNIEKMIYLTQLTQAVAMKTATDVFRSHRTHKRTMGAIYWKLNDNWVAPTSSFIDYFGNYKVVWNWSKEFMAPTVIIALIDVKNSRINVTVTKEELVTEFVKPEKFQIAMHTYLWSELFYKRSRTWEISVGPNGIHTDYLDMQELFSEPFTRDNCFLKFVLFQNNKTISSTFLIPDKISISNGLADPQINYGLTSNYCIKTNILNLQYYSITITIKKPVLFAYIEIYHPHVEKYKLSENGIIITDPIKVIQLEIQLKAKECINLTKENVRLMTINQLLVGETPNNVTNNEEITTQLPTNTVTDTSTMAINNEVNGDVADVVVNTL